MGDLALKRNFELKREEHTQKVDELIAELGTVENVENLQRVNLLDKYNMYVKFYNEHPEIKMKNINPLEIIKKNLESIKKGISKKNLHMRSLMGTDSIKSLIDLRGDPDYKLGSASDEWGKAASTFEFQENPDHDFLNKSPSPFIGPHAGPKKSKKPISYLHNTKSYKPDVKHDSRELPMRNPQIIDPSDKRKEKEGSLENKKNRQRIGNQVRRKDSPGVRLPSPVKIPKPRKNRTWWQRVLRRGRTGKKRGRPRSRPRSRPRGRSRSRSRSRRPRRNKSQSTACKKTCARRRSRGKGKGKGRCRTMRRYD